MKRLAGVEFTQTQYKLLSEHCLSDPTFPTTWESWQALVLEETELARAEGAKVTTLQLDPAAFRRWCTRVEITPCLDALRAYAAVHRAPKATSRYGSTRLDSRPVDLDDE